jgi:hypothetical protein
MPSKDVKKSRSKRVDATILVALIALLGTVVTALSNSPVILEWIRNKPTLTALPAQAQLPSNNSSNTMPATSVPPLSGGDADCLQQYFADIDPSRQISIEVGGTAQDYFLLSQDSFDQNFIGPFGISLTQNGRMIGALSFLFFTDSHLFKITSVVDSNCQAVTDYSNAIIGGDKNAIGNSGTLKIQLAEGMFSLNFQFSGTNFFRFNFQQLQ